MNRVNTCKLIFRNVCKNIRDYLIYFLTLTLSVSLFYAFNSISDQPAFSNMGMTRHDELLAEAVLREVRGLTTRQAVLRLFWLF